MVEEKSTGGEPKVMACAERHAGWGDAVRGLW